MNKLTQEYAGFTITTNLDLDKHALQNWLNDRWGSVLVPFLVTEKEYTGNYCYYITYPTDVTWHGVPLTTDVIYQGLVKLEVAIKEATRQEKLLNMLSPRA